MNVVEIDGSVGEGGGQILRSSLALSVLTGKPLRMSQIRAGRKKPGLMRQHLTAVNAAAEICGAKIKGAELASRQLEFEPGAVVGGQYHFAVGTAGSACLVLQTVLPPLMLCKQKSELVLEGGTHNPFAPPYDFLAASFFPILARMGAKIDAKLVRPGFFPAGGGRIEVTIEPTNTLVPIDVTERGALQDVSAQIVLAMLPEIIAASEMKVLKRELGLRDEQCENVVINEGPGPGNVALVRVQYESHTEVFCGFGQKGVSAGRVAGKLVDEVRKYLDGASPVGVHLADQLILPFALAGSGSFRTVGISAHTATNISVVERFLDVVISTQRIAAGDTLVTFRET